MRLQNRGVYSSNPALYGPFASQAIGFVHYFLLSGPAFYPGPAIFQENPANLRPGFKIRGSPKFPVTLFGSYFCLLRFDYRFTLGYRRGSPAPSEPASRCTLWHLPPDNPHIRGVHSSACLSSSGNRPDALWTKRKPRVKHPDTTPVDAVEAS